ncbi:hypothetical protein IX38_12595 [Chryseobacterium luteum]|uniref:Uncharacterized protein n=1 Tax=Chryseobacterium luteum TaxID=421531 RepID=A0A085ZED9_9FLAO|nr:hypothetical protein IX38_12595 [Chryseobacterium luteum]
MKKLIFKYWITNVLISIILFILYRVVISEMQSDSEGFLDTLLFILEILISLGFSLVFLCGLLVFSLTFFLNLIKKIRDNRFLSLLTFIGIPVICLIYAMIYLSFPLQVNTILIMFVSFSIIYLIITTVQFLMFRKTIKKYINE